MATGLPDSAMHVPGSYRPLDSDPLLTSSSVCKLLKKISQYFSVNDLSVDLHA